MIALSRVCDLHLILAFLTCSFAMFTSTAFIESTDVFVVPGHIRALAPGWLQVTMSLGLQILGGTLNAQEDIIFSL